MIFCRDYTVFDVILCFLERGLKATLEFSNKNSQRHLPLETEKKKIIPDTYSHHFNTLFRDTVEEEYRIMATEILGTLNLGVLFIIVTFLRLLILSFGYFLSVLLNTWFWNF